MVKMAIPKPMLTLDTIMVQAIHIPTIGGGHQAAVDQRTRIEARADRLNQAIHPHHGMPRDWREL